MTQLQIEELDQVTGEEWVFDMLTQAELNEYYWLQVAWQKAEEEENRDFQKVIEKRINAFMEKMDAKYGA